MAELKRLGAMLNLTLVLCFPLLLVQGLWVKFRTPKLPEAEGQRRGKTSCDAPKLKLLVLGDSAAAGVGVARQDLALTGQLVQHLVPNFGIEWQLMAQSGHTTQDALDWLESTKKLQADVVVTSLGVNDVTRFTSWQTFLQRQQRLVDALKTQSGCRQLIITAIPPMQHFPALPQPLRWFMGKRSTLLNQSLTLLQTGDIQSDILYLSLPADPNLMATDGFHPGAQIYRKWAQECAKLIQTNSNNFK